MSPEGKREHDGDIAAQLALCVDNLEAVLKEAGMTLANLIRLNVYTTDVDQLFPHYGVLAGRRGAPPRGGQPPGAGPGATARGAAHRGPSSVTAAMAADARADAERKVADAERQAAEAERKAVEAERQAAEARRLEEQAERHRAAAESARAEHAGLEREADRVDPDLRTDDEGYRVESRTPASRVWSRPPSVPRRSPTTTTRTTSPTPRPVRVAPPTPRRHPRGG